MISYNIMMIISTCHRHYRIDGSIHPIRLLYSYLSTVDFLPFVHQFFSCHWHLRPNFDGSVIISFDYRPPYCIDQKKKSRDFYFTFRRLYSMKDDLFIRLSRLPLNITSIPSSLDATILSVFQQTVQEFPVPLTEKIKKYLAISSYKIPRKQEYVYVYLYTV